MDPTDPNQLAALLYSPQGDNLAPSDWNNLRGLYQNAVNSRAAAWQPQATPQQSVDTFTGKDSQQVGVDPNSLQYFQKFLSNRPAPYSIDGNSLSSNGVPISDNFTGNSQQAAALAQAQAPAFSVAGGIQAMQQDPRFQALNGLQRNAVFTSVVGTDPISYQNQQLTHGQMALKLQQDLLTQQSAIMGQADSLAKSLGAANMGNVMQSYNADPAHPNQFYNPGGYEADPARPGQFLQKPGQWLGADPQDVAALGALRSQLGLSSSTMAQQTAARFAQLHAKGAPTSAATAPVAAPTQSQPQQTMDTAQQAGAARRAALGYLGGTALPYVGNNVISNGLATTANLAAAPIAGLNWLANSAYGALGGSGNLVGNVPQARGSDFSQLPANLLYLLQKSAPQQQQQLGDSGYPLLGP